MVHSLYKMRNSKNLACREAYREKKRWWPMFCYSILILFLCVNFVSAWDWDNDVDYDFEKREVTITNSFGLGKELMKAQLISPDIVELKDMGRGIYQKIGEIKIINIDREEDFNNAFGKIETYDLNKGSSKMNKNVIYKYRSVERTYQSPIQDTVCPKDYKSLDECEIVVVSYITKTDYKWTEFKSFEELPEGEVVIGVFADIKSGEYGEWIPEFFGKKVDEWAVWTVSLNSGIKLYYNMEETSGNATDGVEGLWNGTANYLNYSNTGRVGNGFNFSERVSYLNISSSLLVFDRQNISVAFWIKPKNWEESYYLWSYSDNSDSDPEILMRYNTGTLKVFGNTPYSFALDSLVTPEVNEWSFIVFTMNSTTASLWVNNTLTATDTSIGHSTASGGVFHRIGYGNTGHSFNGTMDEFGLWNRTLTPTEITTLWNTGLGMTYDATPAMNVTLNSPTNNSAQSFGDNVTFNITSESASTSLINITLYINDILNETRDISGLTNETIFTKRLSPGSYNWSVYACDDFECNQSETRFFNLIPFKENSQTFNATTTETSLESFIINVTYISSDWNSLTTILNYNKTNYTGTQTGIGDNIIFTRILNIPSFNSITSVIPFNWFLTFTNNTGSFLYESANYTQTITPINFSFCNSTQTPFINFSTFSATNPFPVINATFKVAWRITAIGGSGTAFNTSFEDISETNSSWAFCFEDESSSYSISAAIEIDGTDYSKNYYYLNDYIINNVTSNIDLYLLNDSLATATVLKVRDAVQSPLSDVYISIQFYDVGTDTFYTVGIARTSSQGEDLVYLNWYDSLYKFILVRNGTTVKSTDPYKITETPQIFDVIFDTPYDFQKFEDFEYSLIFNNNTNNFVLTFVKPSGDVEAGCLRVIKRNQTNDYTICKTCETSSSATVYCNIAGQGNGTFIATFYATGSLKIIDSISTLIGIAGSVYEEIGNLDGTVMAIILAGIIMSFFLISPMLGVVGLIIGMLATYAIGFQPIDYFTFIGLIIVGGIVIWFLNK